MEFRSTSVAVGGLLLLVVVATPTTASKPLHAAPSADPGADVSPGLATASCEWPLLDFARRQYVGQRGEVVRVTLLFQADFDDGIHFSLLGPDDELRLSATLSNGDDDRHLTLLVDTAANATRPRLRTASAADEIDGLTVTASENSLSTGTYDARVVGSGCAQGDARLVVEEPTPLSVHAYRGNRSLLADGTTVATVERTLRRGDLRRSYDHDLPTDGVETFVLRGETLAVAVESPALAERVAAAGSPTTGEDLRAVVRKALSVTVTESRFSVDRSEDVDRNDLSSFDGWRAVADPADDTLYLLLDTRAPFAPDDEHRDYGTVGDRYVVTVETADGTNATTAFEFARPAAEFDRPDHDDRMVLTARDNATVGGRTDLPDGTRVTVALRVGTDGTSPPTTTTTVEDGRFAGTFDLTGVENGTTFEAVVRHGGATVASESGRIRGASNVNFGENVLHVSVRELDEARLERVSTTAGGFVVLHDGYSGGPVVGVSEYLPPGDHTDVAVSLNGSWDGPLTLAAVVHRDGDGDRQFDPDADPVYWGGSPKDAARFVDERVETTGTAAAPVTPATLTETTPRGSDTVPGPGPGLAIVALAFVALALAAFAGRNGGGSP